MPEPRTIHVVDSDRPQRVALMQRLALAGHEVRTFASLGEYVRARAERPDCILAGISARDSETLAIRRTAPEATAPTPVVYLSSDADIPLAVGAMKAGAIDFLMLPVSDADLKAVLDRAHEMADVWQAAHVEHARANALLARLTPRERAIFVRILAGDRNKQIAAALDSQEATVKVHRSRLMKKLGARTLADLLHVGREVEAVLADDLPPEPPRQVRVPRATPAVRPQPQTASGATRPVTADALRTAPVRPTLGAALAML